MKKLIITVSGKQDSGKTHTIKKAYQPAWLGAFGYALHKKAN